MIRSRIGFFIDNELVYCPMVIMPISKGLIPMYLPSADKAKSIYTILSAKGQKKAIIEEQLPDYYDDNYYPDGESLFKLNVPVDSILLLYANAILSTPDDYHINKRNEIFNEILNWFHNNSGKEYLIFTKSQNSEIIPDSYALKISANNNMSIIPYYQVCLAKTLIENRNLSDIEIKIKATEYLIKYIFNKSNFGEYSSISYQLIKKDKLLVSLKKMNNIKKLVEEFEKNE
jgi:hypothetical protein